MRHRSMTLLACSGAVALASGAAEAAFIGVRVVDATQWMTSVAPSAIRMNFNAAGGASQYRVWRVFAMFDDTGVNNPENHVEAIYGTNQYPWRMWLQNSYNYIVNPGGPNEVHNNLPPTSSASNVAHLGWETWATIGTQNTPSNAIWSPGSEAQLNNFTDSFITATSASLSIARDDPNGNAVALNPTTAAGMGGYGGYGVLLMQFTTDHHSHGAIDGVFNIRINGVEWNGVKYSNLAPSPGVLSVLAFAAFMPSRRRR